MNTSRLFLAVLSSAFASLILTPSAFSQGALTPPSAPAPTMKTLDQIEARKTLGTPNVVTTSTIVISEPGSYVLVGPITVAGGDGITINTSNVSLDLNGFTISSTAPSDDASSGVKINGDGTNVSNVSVSNGFISGAYNVALDGTGAGSGFTNGIYCFLARSTNLRAVQISVQGVRGIGINFGNAVFGNQGSIHDCQCSHTGSTALVASIVENCIVRSIGITASGCINADVVNNCTVDGSTCSTGIIATTVSNSVASARDSGITATTVTNCIGSGTTGITASMVTNSTGTAGTTGNNLRGISCPNGTVSFSRGFAAPGGSNRSIVAAIAVACTSEAGSAPIESGSKQLGTP